MLNKDQKVLLEALAVTQRILAKIIAGDKITGEEFDSLARSANKINLLLLDEKSKTQETPLEIEVSRYIDELGIPKNIKGYRYLRSSIIIRFNDGKNMESFTHQLYPAVAKEYDSTAARVERAMRHAIEVAYNKGFFADNELYSCMVKKPTISYVVATIVDDLKLRHL